MENHNLKSGILNKAYKKARREVSELNHLLSDHSYNVISLDPPRSDLNETRVNTSSTSNVTMIDPVEDPSVSCSSDSDSKRGSSSNDEFINDLVPHQNTVQDVEQVRTEEMSLSLQLGKWALENNITQLAFTKLLHILKPVHPELPLDARTLLKTPRDLVLKTVEPGQYYHFGFRKCIEKFIPQLTCHDSNLIELCINIDGLPLTKSSGSQLYPILCNVFGTNSTVNIIGLYHGNEKPKSANDFLYDFVTEAVDILTNGVVYNSCNYIIKIKAFICDVPAKAFIKYTKGHSGYMSCTKCVSVGSYYNRICFPDIHDLVLRNDFNFRSKAQEEHHTGTSILEMLPDIDMIQDFPVEYMHLICLGVVKKLIVSLWIEGKPKSKLSFQQLSQISSSLLKCSSHIPAEFNRKPRSINDSKRWKATEFRLFLFYLGPVVLKHVLSLDKYINFLSLHLAISLLASKKYLQYIDYSESLLNYFVETFIAIYGVEHVSHNIHNLLHLCQDVKRFGPLDMFSAFPFENHMRSLKILCRKGDKPLQQIARRLNEHENILSDQLESFKIDYPQTLIEHSSGPILREFADSKQYKKIKLSNYLLTSSSPNNCCSLLDDSVVIIRNFLVHNNEIVIIGQKLLKKEDFYISPCNSSEFGIYISSTPGPLHHWKFSEVSNKCVKLEIEKEKYVVFPLLHSL